MAYSLKNRIFCLFMTSISLITWLETDGKSEATGSMAAVYKQLSAIQCDSLIKANATNADFAIIDVRTPGEFDSGHLAGAVNLNSGDASFSTRLNKLNKQKIYLIHCASGSRSAPVFTAMKTAQFSAVYEMKNGIYAWTSSSLPTTTAVAPKLAIATKGLDTLRTVKTGKTDTLKIRITNRANDTLKFTSITAFTNPEFKAIFDLGTKLEGAADYSFLILFSPTDLMEHSVKFVISSNGGNEEFTLNRKGTGTSGILVNPLAEIKIYPNPASENILFDNLPSEKNIEFRLTEVGGKTVSTGIIPQSKMLDVRSFSSGWYILQMKAGESIVSKKIGIVRFK